MASEQNGFVLETGNSSMSSLSDSDINPPSSVQKSNHLSDRLDFSHVDGGKMAARMEEKDAGRQEAEKRKLDEGLEDGELSTDSEFEAPRKYQKTDKVNFSASTEVNSSTSFEDESSKTDIETMEMEGEGETTLTESQNFAEEFHIVDDAEIDEDDGNGVNADNVDSDDDLDDNEIYAWLEEGIEKQGTKPVTTGSQEDEEAYTEKEKIILKEISRNPFEVLPEGWVMVTHNSGMPIYLHKQSRVCTAAKPYFLGSGSVRKHSIPVSGIPCLHYRREKEKIAKSQERNQTTGGEPVQSSNSVPVQSSEPVPVQSSESIPVQSSEPLPVQSSESIPVQSSEPVPVQSSEPVPVQSSESIPVQSSEPLPVQSSESIPVQISKSIPVQSSEPLPVQSSESIPVQSSESIPVLTNGSVPVKCNEGDPVKDKEVVPVKENGEEVEKVIQNGESTENPEQQPKNNPVPPDKVGPIPPPEIKTVEHTEKEYSIEPDDLHKYCEGLFDFKTIIVKKFTSWKDKRRHLNKEKIQSRPSLPSDIKLITCPIQPADKSKAEKTKRREFVLNPVGKTPLCILHEYVQHVLRVQPEYIFKELESAATPYSATVRINKIEYATGLGSSKKQAKLEGAKKALEILIPHLQLDEETKTKKDDSFGDMTFFDEITVEDPRIADLCNKAGMNKPYQVLQECLKRNYGMGESKILINKKVISNQRSEFTITVGKHTASVVSKNKREGKQKAAQAMLQLLHPHIKSWGSILRLYSESTIKGFKEKDEEPVTQLQSKHSSLNAEILKKLKDAMMKLSETREQFASKGTLRIAYRTPQSQVKNIDL